MNRQPCVSTRPLGPRRFGIWVDVRCIFLCRQTSAGRRRTGRAPRPGRARPRYPPRRATGREPCSVERNWWSAWSALHGHGTRHEWGLLLRRPICDYNALARSAIRAVSVIDDTRVKGGTCMKTNHGAPRKRQAFLPARGSGSPHLTRPPPLRLPCAARLRGRAAPARPSQRRAARAARCAPRAVVGACRRGRRHGDVSRGRAGSR